MYEIDAKVLMANYFYHNPESSLDNRKIKKIEKKIYNNLSKDVADQLIINVTDESLDFVVENSCLFNRDSNEIRRIKKAGNSERYYNKAYLKYINYELSSEIIEAVELACKTNYEDN